MKIIMKNKFNRNNILLLTQGSQRSIYLESLVFELKSKGYNIIFGSIGKHGPLQNALSGKGLNVIA